MRVHQTQTQQQRINTQTLLPYSGFITNTLQQTPLIPALPKVPKIELINHSNTRQFSTQRINFANVHKNQSSEKHINTVSNFNDPQEVSLISDNSVSEPLISQFSSPTPSDIASKPFNPPH